MSVVITAVITLVILWVFGPKDFAIFISIMIGVLALLEAVSLVRYKKTITQLFRKWSDAQPRWKTWLIAITIMAAGIFFGLHLAIGI